MQGILVTLTVIFIFLKATRIFSVEIPESIYFGWFAFIGIINCLQNKNKLSILTLIVIYVAVISLLLNDKILLPFLNNWLRLVTFIVMLLGVGPLLSGFKIDLFKEKLFTSSMYVMTITVLISFLLYITNHPLGYVQRIGGSVYAGLYGSPMTLSPLAAIVTLFLINKAFNTRIKKERMFYCILIIISFFTVIVSASRGALGAFLVALLFYLTIHYQGQIGKLLRLMSAVVILSVISVPIWVSSFDNLIKKQESREEAGGLLSSRESMWDDRLADFKYNPLIGVGFSNVYNTNNSIVHESTGGVEAGSGWLMLLGSLGILGFIPVFILFFNAFFVIIKLKCFCDCNILLYCTIVLFFACHSLVEGYIFGVGGPLFLYMWLTIALVNKNKLSVVK